MNVIHPRPNPIVAAMYTLRDMDIDVIIVHGPAGCGFMASRMLEEAGVRVVTSGIVENDLVFGASEPLIRTLNEVEDRFKPKTVAVIGTCASMIIGEDMQAAIKRAALPCRVFAVNCHGCMGDNTEGAIKALEAGRDAGLMSAEEASRQIMMMKAATKMEKDVGMAGQKYLSPVSGPTKFNVSRKAVETLRAGKKVAVVMIAKKELAYRFADIFLAMDEAKRKLGGELFFAANLDAGVGLPRIRRYASDINAELSSKGVAIDRVIGGLDEYAVVGERMREAVSAFGPDLLIIVGIPHAYPGYAKEDILITDQPRQLANYLNHGYPLAVGEISSHSIVMGTRKIVPLETGDTIRELSGCP
jgi:putative methanogenesis marker 13 metalloprotein